MPEIPPLTGPGWDFDVFWLVGRAVLTGADPYAIVGSFYPPATLLLFSLFALMPQTIAYLSWLFLNILILVKTVTPRRAPLWALYMPVAFIFASGQLDLAFLFLATRIDRTIPAAWHAPLVAATITLKPQIAFVLLPWFLVRWLQAAYRGTDKKTLLRFLAASLILHLLPLLFGLNLYSQWFQKMGGALLPAAPATPGVFSLVSVGIPWSFLSLIAIAVALASWLSSDERLARAGGLFALPIGHYYSSVVLIEVAPWWLLVPLSWVSLIVAHKVGAFYPIASLAFVALAWRFAKVKRCNRNRGHLQID